MIEVHTLQVLDYHKITARLECFSLFPEGGELLRSLKPATSYNQACLSLAKTSEVILSLRERADLWRESIPAVSGIFQRLSKINGVISAAEVAVFLKFLPAANRLRVFFEGRDTYPLWFERCLIVIDFSELSQAVMRLVDEKGFVQDKASANLARIRREQRKVREKIKDILNGYLQSSNLSDVIAEKLITQRNGRYVIPVVRGNERKLRGIIQDTSKSGATVFIEPERTVELNNSLARLSSDEGDEIAYLLAKMSDLLRAKLSELRSAANVLADFDSYYARNRLAEEMRASAPLLNNEGVIEIKDGLHPLLLYAKGAGEVVAQSIKIGDGYRTLVITGPNTGGKTVALKMTGLLTLMALSGMYIPARSNSQIAFFDKIFADIGDEQSLEQSLSTFSGHMTHVVRMLKEASTSALYLIDELGAGTDPTEGAALAVSITEKLHELGATVLVATHFRLLKNFASKHDEMENASVEFDEESLLPTYRLKLGFLGTSRAIITAKRLGLSDDVVARANSRISENEFKLDQLLVKLENEDKRQETVKEELEAKQERISQLADEFEEKKLNLKKFSTEKRRQAQREVKQLLSSARREIAQLLEDARLAEKSEAIKKIADDIKQREQAAMLELEKLTKPRPRVKNTRELMVGESVYIEGLNLTGLLLCTMPDKGSAKVECGEKVVEVALSELVLSEKPLSATFREMGFELERHKSVGPELNIIGKRLDEAMDELESYLDAALLSHFKKVYIIHGIGGDVLRKNVASVLASHPQITRYHPGLSNEGGAGVTVVELDS